MCIAHPYGNLYHVPLSTHTHMPQGSGIILEEREKKTTGATEEVGDWSETVSLDMAGPLYS